ncbi:T9SS type A sorting domain-containing protein [Algibacter amylolyticus]|uniref:T9SS type A sorting domain-containing protein n=1 Tax=Algibacter amylolyticus TaxID=1608400 RepID=A0A5M7BFA7_9FLAO|nr:alpha-amylase family glycosyl hydrolase [Algibacter amylolyticus]KAA5828009.1 T9SS type A sorting domain-containing protein [Algibacter amylolyticus]MBB5267252.1 glycosidase [Algibacter amylolyticus]TSJ82254.1 T9SS type A sorting domain-containing protein [Algibacter amylolyticus]
MKKLVLIFLLFINWCFAQQQTVTHTVSPSPFEEDDNITITIQGSSINEVTWGVTGNELYLWAWSLDTNLANEQGCPTNGSWDNSNEAHKLTYNSGADTYTISFVPTAFFSRTNIGRIGFLVKAKDGSGDKKSQDILENVGAFQLSLSAPSNTTSIINSGSNLNITASNTGGNAGYILKANGSTINTQSGIASYAYTDTNITANRNYILEVTVGGVTKTKSFSVIVDPGSEFSVMPQTYLDGITYDNSDPTKATLVLYATGKDFVYVAGSFNNWQPDASYAMKRDPSRNNKFWLTLTGLTPGQIETFQYWVVDKTPIANSPTLVKTADPYSTLVLSPFDDPYIPASTYPNLPTYPAGQDREVTVLQTGKTPYNWQVTNFEKPKKEDLVIYEVLIRDFDADRNFQDLIDKIDYFKNLNINAIELMPIMEFEGNESWGYNTSFHMALDKFYGTEDKFKELVDVCHQNGIAVILDVALNHAFGRNPMVRMWMNDPDGDGWGEPSSENPYFNETAKHTYSVGSDFDHSNSFTNVYTKRVVKHWIEEFNIDGFRWDLTKGFTQECSFGDEGCTNSYQQDRVDILKDYADYSWSLDETHYVIFEHLGATSEEQQWANYRIGDAIPKGVMMWSEMWTPYKNLAQGQTTDINFDRMGHNAHGFTEKRALGFPESHDKDRIMYEMTAFGTSTNPSHDVTDLNIALKRMSALGAISLTVPGPKMVWHFAELGMENSIWMCANGAVNTDYDGNNDGDCKLDTKPQPQWTNNWLNDTNRSQVYKDWSRLNALKINEAVFEGNYNITSGTQTPRISIYTGNENTSDTALKNVIIIANFSVTNQTVNPSFPYSGDWYDLMDESATTATIDGSTTAVNLAPGEFKVYGNQTSTLSTKDYEQPLNTKIYPNPASTSFQVNTALEAVLIYDITGKLVKTFRGEFSAGNAFDIANLKPSIYLVKITNTVGATHTVKLVKQ